MYVCMYVCTRILGPGSMMQRELLGPAWDPRVLVMDLSVDLFVMDLFKVLVTLVVHEIPVASMRVDV